MSDRRGILGAGNWIVDHIKVIDAWPSQDKLANIRTEFRGTGGAPCNVLIDLAKLGANFPLTGAGIVGKDEAGDWILKTCKKFRREYRADSADRPAANLLHRCDVGRANRTPNIFSPERREHLARCGLDLCRCL